MTTVTVRRSELQTFYADIVITAIEGGINYWAQVHSYAWHSPNISGGTADPAPGGGDNAYAVISATDDGDGEGDDDGTTHAVTVDTIAHAFTILAAGPVQYLSDQARRRYLAARRELDAGELDAGDADNLLQLGIFGQIVYG